MDKQMDSYMVTSPYVIEPGQTPRDAMELMRDCDIRHLPVVEDDRLVGVVSDADVREALALEQSSKVLIRDIMKTDVYAVPHSAVLRDVISDMMQMKIGSIVVTNREKEVVGIFTTIDALRMLLDYLDNDPTETASMDEYFESWDADYQTDVEEKTWPL